MKRAACAGLLLLASAWPPALARAEYCIDWSGPLARATGRSGHCWSTEPECNAYYNSRCLSGSYRNDCAGGCYYKPGLYSRTGSAKGGGKSPVGNGNAGEKEFAEHEKKVQEHKRQSDAARQQLFDHDLNTLKNQVKPPPDGTAVRQLKELVGSGAEAVRGLNDPGRSPGKRDEAAREQAGWPGTLKAPPPTVVVPKPVPAPVEEDKGKAVNLRALLDAIAGKRRDIAAQDEEIRTLEQRVEQAKTGGKVDPGASKEDDALRKAQEALARARANRERTRTELEQMEKLEGEAGR